MCFSQGSDQNGIVIRSIGLAQRDRSTTSSQRQRYRDCNDTLLVTHCGLLVAFNPCGNDARHLGRLHKVDSIGSQVDGVKPTVRIDAWQQSFEGTRNQLFDRGCGDAVQYAFWCAAALDRRRDVITI